MSEQPPYPGSDPTQPPPHGSQPPPPPYGSQPPPAYGSQPPPDADPSGTPAPPPAYGAPPPPPPAYGYGAEQPPMPPPPPGSFGPHFSASAAVGYGWRAFKADPGPFLGIAVLMLVVGGSFSGVSESSSGFGVQFIVQLLGQVLSYLIGAALMKGALDAVSGRPVGFGAMFEGWDKLQVVLAALLIAIGTIIGLVLLIIPGIIWAILTVFTMYFVIDEGQDAVTAIKSSIALVRANVGGTIMLGLISLGVAVLGLLALCVGIIVAIPVIYVAAAYAYRVFRGQPVAVQS